MRILLLLLSLQLSPAPATAPQRPTVSIITIGPGEAVYERFGHNMIHIQDPANGIDAVFNWGIYDFDQPHFVFNFIQGRMIYIMFGSEGQRSIEVYKTMGRTMWEQELNLSQAQVRTLLDYCRWNDTDANRAYRYDYYLDNCSTRVRDALDLALGGQIKRIATSQPSAVTFRSETNRLMADDWPIYISLDYVLGHPVDQKLSAWDEMFIPMRLRERLNELKVINESGESIPLVKSETVLMKSPDIVERPAKPNRVAIFFILGTVLGGGLVAMAQAAGRRKAAKWGFYAILWFWSLLASFAGAFLAYTWIATDHAATRPNENILQLNPSLLLLIVLAPMALRGKAKAAKIGLILAGIGLGGSILGLFLKALPIMFQSNGNIIALALPINAGLFWVMYRYNQRATAAAEIGKRSLK